VPQLPVDINGGVSYDARLPILAILMHFLFPPLRPLSKTLFLLQILSRGIDSELSRSTQEEIQGQISV